MNNNEWISVNDSLPEKAGVYAGAGFPEANEVSFGGSGFRLPTEKSMTRYLWTLSGTGERSSCGRT